MSPDLVITGIPRSGTSYVCALLNGVKNTVLVNEPVEALQYLRNDSARTLTEYYARARDDIIKRIPIQNKIVEGRFIEDTDEIDVRSYYVPEVENTSFVFGSKNTFVYLLSLEKIRKQLPDAGIIACIRHPYDTIASWKRVKFPHLRNANPMFFVDYARDLDKRKIVEIGRTRQIENRYALLWDFLARCIIRSADGVIRLKYEEFVNNPGKYVADVYNVLGIGLKSMPVMLPSSVRIRREDLSTAEVDAIRKYCAASSGYFGYEL